LTKNETSASAVGNATVNEMNPFRQKTLVVPPTFTCTVIDNKRSDTEEDRENSKNMEYQSEDFLFQPKKTFCSNPRWRSLQINQRMRLVLTEVRRNDEWDLAVAELMTQVLVVLHCSDKGDYGLEGLRRYY